MAILINRLPADSCRLLTADPAAGTVELTVRGPRRSSPGRAAGAARGGAAGPRGRCATLDRVTEVPGAVVDGGEVAQLEMLTRSLIGITLQGLEVLGDAVSLPQFRLLLAASALGRAPSSRLAEATGVPASSVTRLADRLVAHGLLARGTDARSRSIVTIEITGAGRELVDRVVERRHELLAAVLARMAPQERTAVATAAARFTALAADAAALGGTGPLPL